MEGLFVLLIFGLYATASYLWYRLKDNQHNRYRHPELKVSEEWLCNHCTGEKWPGRKDARFGTRAWDINNKEITWMGPDTFLSGDSNPDSYRRLSHFELRKGEKWLANMFKNETWPEDTRQDVRFGTFAFDINGNVLPSMLPVFCPLKDSRGE